MEKVDSCHDGHELFRNPKQRLGGKRDIAGSKQSKNEDGMVKVVVIDWKQTRKIWKDWCMLKVGGNIVANKVAGVVQRIDIDEFNIKRRKASGPTRVVLETLKAAGESYLKPLTAIFNILLEIKLPDEWVFEFQFLKGTEIPGE